MMNLLIVADYGAPMSGNFIASMLELANRLKENGNDTVFLFKQTDEQRCHWIRWLREYGYSVLSIDEEMPIDEQFTGILEEYHIDIIHDHFGYLHRYLVYNARKFLHAKVIIHQHMDFPIGKNKLNEKIQIALMSVMYRMQGVSNISVMKEKSDSFLFCRHWFIPNGLSFMRHVEYSMTGDEYRAKLGIPPDTKMCLFLGWDFKRKGLDIAIKAINILRDQGCKVILGVVGFGGGMSDETKQALYEMTAIDPSSDFIWYLQSEEDMFALHRAADVYLSASRSEAFSYGILEAISQNTPVVCSDIEGTRWCAEYSKSFFYPVEDAYACAKQIQNALEMQNERSNADEIVERYSIDKWCADIMEVYREIYKGQL